LSLDDDEHVVDADAEEQEREDVVHRAEHETDGGTKPVRHDDAHGHADEAGDGQVRPDLDEAELTQRGRVSLL
jgi:hypothetical protein